MSRAILKVHCLVMFRHTGLQSIESLPRQLPFLNTAESFTDARA